jgi:hypothetical protein
MFEEAVGGMEDAWRTSELHRYNYPDALGALGGVDARP